MIRLLGVLLTMTMLLESCTVFYCRKNFSEDNRTQLNIVLKNKIDFLGGPDIPFSTSEIENRNDVILFAQKNVEKRFIVRDSGFDFELLTLISFNSVDKNEDYALVALASAYIIPLRSRFLLKVQSILYSKEGKELKRYEDAFEHQRYIQIFLLPLSFFYSPSKKWKEVFFDLIIEHYDKIEKDLIDKNLSTKSQQ